MIDCDGVRPTNFYILINYRVVEKGMTTANKVFLESCMSIEANQIHLSELNELITKEILQIEEQNLRVSAAKCKKALNELYEPLEADMNERYMVPGGYSLLKPEMDKFKMNYLQMSMNEEFGPCKGQALKDFEDERVMFVDLFINPPASKVSRGVY